MTSVALSWRDALFPQLASPPPLHSPCGVRSTAPLLCCPAPLPAALPLPHCSDCDSCSEWGASLSGPLLLKRQLSAIMERNPSTATTPCSEDARSDASSRSSSPISFSFVGRWDAESDSDTWSSDAELESDTADTSHLCRFRWRDCDSAAECTDEEAEDGEGVPVSEDECSDSEDTDWTGDNESGSSLNRSLCLLPDLRLVPRVPAAPSSGVGSVHSAATLALRQRHVHLSDHFTGGSGGYWDRRKGGYRVRWFQTRGSLRRLQVASSNACLSQQASKRFSAPTEERRDIPNPYSAYERKEEEEEERARAKARRNRKDGSQRHQRTAHQKAVHSLDSHNRPAMKNARSSAHRLVLQQRAARKQQLKQQAAARSCGSQARRRCSAVPRFGPKRSALTTPSSGSSFYTPPAPVLSVRPSVDHSVSTLDCRDFEEFRFHFFRRRQQQLERAFELCNYRARAQVDAIRSCPINANSRANFLNTLRSLKPRQEEVALVFHGTRHSNMDSICRRGLLVPNAQNDVRVEHGSSLGVGIYTAREPHMSLGYTHGVSTLFVCAAITTGAVARCSSEGQPAAISSGGMVVLGEEARVCPLFLLDFSYRDGGWSHSTGHSPAFIPKWLARMLLAKRHTNIRRTQWSARDRGAAMEEQIQMSSSQEAA